MKVLPVLPLLWPSLLGLLASQGETEGNNADICQSQHDLKLNASFEDFIDREDVKEAFDCLLYPSNILNCSWSFHTVERASQLAVHISICDNDVEALSLVSVEKVGSFSGNVSEFELSSVVLQFNVTQLDTWTSYIFVYNLCMLDVHSPPTNIRTSVEDGDLIVEWDLPHSRETYHPDCFEYQLDMGDQNQYRNLSDQQSHREKNINRYHTYSLRMRSRVTDDCCKRSKWSDWSRTVIVEASLHTISPLVVILLSLGIPMILLAVLLFVRHQRVMEHLFPPIPQPPLKYKHFLEKTDAFNFFQSTAPEKNEEEITEVEDQNLPPENSRFAHDEHTF